MTDEAWRRHANPWNVWTRFAALPALALALATWCRAWIGWWAPGPLAAVAAWLVLNPRVFPAVPASRGWASRGIHGERLWLEEPERAPPAHRGRPAVAGAARADRARLAVLGAVRLSLWPTLLGRGAVALAQLWRIDRLGRRHYEAVGGEARSD